MTEHDKIQLSKQVAELYGVDYGRLLDSSDYGYTSLADDSARCFELAVEFMIDISQWENMAEAFGVGVTSGIEYFSNHPTKAEATRIAILKCLVKMKESE